MNRYITFINNQYIHFIIIIIISSRLLLLLYEVEVSMKHKGAPLPNLTNNKLNCKHFLPP